MIFEISFIVGLDCMLVRISFLAGLCCMLRISFRGLVGRTIVVRCCGSIGRSGSWTEASRRRGQSEAAEGVHDWCEIDDVSVGVRVGVACLKKIFTKFSRR